MAKLNIVIFACIVALTSCNKAPDCSFESPKDKDIFSTSDSIVVTINAEDKKGSVTEVSLHIDNNLFETIKYTPYQFTIRQEPYLKEVIHLKQQLPTMKALLEKQR
jgi:hypothetical protein